MKKSILLLLISLLVSQIQAQWIANYWGNNTGDNQILNTKGFAVVTDHENNCYVTGYTVNSGSGSDIILIKYNDQGDTLFSRVYSGTGDGEDRAFGIAVDELDNVYISGQVSMSGRGLELIVLKYHKSGNLLWAKTYGATTKNKDDAGLAVTLDDDNNIYITGFCTGDNGSVSLLIQKYLPNGTRVWSKIENSERNHSSQGKDIKSDSEGYIYVTGNSTKGNNAHSSDILTVKYNEEGDKVWSSIYSGQQQLEDRAFGIAVDESDNVYVTGFITVNKNNNNTSALLLKYGSGGQLIWTRTVEQGGKSSEDKAFGILVDNNYIYITGQIATVSNALDYMTAKYNQNGERLWLSTYDGPVHGIDVAYAIAPLGNNKVVVTGSSYGINDNFDFATVIISKSGENLQTERYTMTKISTDIAMDVAVSGNNKIFVTGYSEVTSVSGSPCGMVTQKIIDENAGLKENTIAPEKFSLSQNYPNPFNPSTTIKFSIVENSHVNLVIYDMMGRTVDILVDNELTSGEYSITYTNKNLSSGIYFYSFSAGSFNDVKKMTLVK